MSNYKERIDTLITSIINQQTSLSYSALSAFRKSPKDFIEYKFQEKKQTDAMAYGTMLHMLVLQPGEFENKYAVYDDADIIASIGGAKPTATTRYKEDKAIFEAENEGKIIVSLDDYKEASEVANNVKYNRASKSIIERCTEFEKYYEWDYMNFKFRGVLDAKGENVIFDLKSCADATPRIFQRDAIKMGYHLQAVLYHQAVKFEYPYYIIACDKKGGVSVHKVTLELLEYGKRELENLMSEFNRCILEDRWNESFEFWTPRFDGSYELDKLTYL